ncbi:MAG: GNAT family N-acetyltransferase [Burkholderiaceae bacterium]
MTVAVTHNESRKRFETTVDGQLCVADYQLRGDVLWMTHTGVPPAVGGRGIAAELVRVALEWADARGFKVEPACSYVEVYMRRHPQTHKLLAR